MNTRKRTLLGYGLILLYGLIAAGAVSRDLRPGAEVDPVSDFSPTAMREHLKVIAREPHPAGTPANEAVRRYITGQLRSMGVRYESVPRFFARSGFLNIHVGARIRNVVARIPGKPGRDTLLVMAHYDSRPFAPGANDDGAAVASMLETIRVIKRGSTPRNNIIFLFTDGEELGLLGARSFRGDNPYAKDVGLVLNFEGRGRTGPTLLFETSGPDAGLVRTFARRSPNPAGASLAASVYRMMPNDTDFSPFRKAGVPGLNFAYMGDVSSYHTMLDNFDSLDDGTLRHQGRTMLALTRTFAERDLKKLGKGSATFFNFDSLLIHYSNFTARILAGLAVLAWIVCVVHGLRGRFITAGSLGRGFLLTLGAMLGAGILVFAIRWAVNLIHPDYAFMPNGDTYNVVWYRIAYTLTALCLTFALYAGFRGHGGMAGPFLGGLGVWALFTLATGIFLPGAGYLFTWPLLVCCVFLLFAAWREERRSSTAATLLVFALFTCVWVYFIAGTLLIAIQGLTLRSIAFVMPVAALALVPLFPVLDIIRLALRPVIFAGIFAIVASLIVGAFTGGFDSKRPQLDSLIFAYNRDSGKAAWLSCDPAPDVWTARFIGRDPKVGDVKDFLPVLKMCPGPSRAPFRAEAKAPRGLRAPRAFVVSDRTRKGIRTVRLRLRSSRDARGLHAFIDRRDVFIENIRVNGILTKEKSDPEPKLGYAGIRRFIDFEAWESFLVYPGTGRGYTLEVSLRARQESKQTGRPVLKIMVVDQSMGLAAAGVPIPPRPAHIMPSSGSPLHDSVLVSRRFEFR